MFEDEFLREEANNGSAAFDVTFTVKDWLQIELGRQFGTNVYTRMKQVAEAACAAQDVGGKPGILFTDNGGAFVSLDE